MNKYLLYISFISILVFALSCKVSDPDLDNSTNDSEWTMVWNDEFDIDGVVDQNKWSYDLGDGCDIPAGCGWGNHELQYYTDFKRNVRVEDGNLIIETHKEKFKNSDYTSARLVTKGKGDWLYGKVEVRAIIPKGLGVWSAIWMLPTENKYGGWPRSGEIDIMENVGLDPDTIVGSAHTLSYHHSKGTHKNGKLYVPNTKDQMHLYTLEWEEDEYRIYVDDSLLFTFVDEKTGFEAWPFDQKFYLILNIAFGGDWGGMNGVDPTILPARLLVDYVRVYQKNV